MYILDATIDKDYFILIKGESKIKYSKKANTLDQVALSLKKMGVTDLKIIKEEQE